MTKGFVSVHRKMMDNPIWSDPHYLKLWMYCLFSATHTQHEQLIGNKMITLERGQFPTGRYSLAEDMNKGMKPKQKLNEKTWWRYLLNLEKWGMLTIKSTNKYSIVTVDKYDFYQTPGNQYDQGTDQQKSNKCPSNVQQMSTNNNGNNGNNENKKRQRLKYESSDMDLAEKLLGLIEDNGEKLSPNYNLEKWANEFRLMRERDERTHEQIDYLIEWSQNHHFWKKNILSGDKIRKHYDQMVRQVKEEKGQDNKPSEPQKTPEQIEYEKMARGEI